MAKQWNLHLSRRERQIMDIIYRLGEATAHEVHEKMPNPPSYSAVRAALRVLEQKGHVRHQYRGPRYVFKPTVSRDKARKAVLKQVVQTFFEGSTSQVVNTLLDISESTIPDDDLDRLSELIEKVRKENQ